MLRNDDWMFLLAATPSLPGEADGVPSGREAWAWPIRKEGRLTTTFCCHDGHAWSTRNLTRRYLGERRVPEPGGWRCRPAREQPPAYWGIDGQFWQPHPG